MVHHVLTSPRPYVVNHVLTSPRPYVVNHELTSPPRGRTGERGFTLIELVIVIVVVSVAALVFSKMFIEAVRSYEWVDVEKEKLQEARYAQERMTREFRRVRDNVSINAATATTFTFVDRDAATITISWNGVKGADLVYTRNGTQRVLASGVDSLAFAYWKTNGTAAAPVLSPSATDIWRVTTYLRLDKAGHTVETVGAAYVRNL
jgi:prepilin-type N-terminal cleavage/methylation domain-containing protein